MASYGATGAAGIRSDDFSLGSLDTWWTEKTEGTSSMAFEGNDTVNFTTPNDQSYEWTGDNQTYRGIEQAMTTGEDFTIEAGWTVWPQVEFDQMGIGVYDGTRNVLAKAECYRSGSNLVILGAVESDAPYASTTVAAPTTSYAMRFKWVDSTTTITVSYKIDAGSWTDISPTKVWGNVPDVCVLYSGRTGGSTSFTSKATYFWEMSAPITPGSTRRVMVIS